MARPSKRRFELVIRKLISYNSEKSLVNLMSYLSLS